MSHPTFRDLAIRYATEALTGLSPGTTYQAARAALRAASPQLSGGNPAEVRIWAEESRKALKAWREERQGGGGSQELF